MRRVEMVNGALAIPAEKHNRKIGYTFKLRPNYAGLLSCAIRM